MQSPKVILVNIPFEINFTLVNNNLELLKIDTTLQVTGLSELSNKQAKIISTLDFRDGAFTRSLVFRNHDGKETEVVARHCVSMANKHLAAVEYSVTPLNYSGLITVKTGLHADHINDGVGRYAKLDQQQ